MALTSVTYYQRNLGWGLFSTHHTHFTWQPSLLACRRGGIKFKWAKVFWDPIDVGSSLKISLRLSLTMVLCNSVMMSLIVPFFDGFVKPNSRIWVRFSRWLTHKQRFPLALRFPWSSFLRFSTAIIDLIGRPRKVLFVSSLENVHKPRGNRSGRELSKSSRYCFKA